MKAFAVLEENENTGAIIFAKHAVTARRLGADEYADGEFGAVRCNRAPWADHCADSGIVPAALMIQHGWHFECSGCGHRIDLEFLDDRDIHLDDIQGGQHGAVFCTPLCEARHNLDRAEAKHMETRWIRRFKRIILRRFPDATIIPSDGNFRGPHAYAPRRGDGVRRIEQVIVPFEWPGQVIGAASLRIDMLTDYSVRPSVSRRGKPHWVCCNGDREAFEAYAASHAKKSDS